MFRKKSIDEWSLRYWLLQQYMKLVYWVYFRKVESINNSNLPRKMPVILAPNHQNALIDALAFCYDTELQTVFLARADIFKKKTIAAILNYLNIMPVFRIRDGISNVRKNDEIFEKCLRIIHNKLNPLCIFPEGNHADKRRIQPPGEGYISYCPYGAGDLWRNTCRKNCTCRYRLQPLSKIQEHAFPELREAH